MNVIQYILQKNIKTGLEKNDCGLVRENCISVLKWGGVNNVERVNNLNIIEKLYDIREKINLESFDIEQIKCLGYPCNSGFSKIYSMIIDDFIIYDSRVSSAICLFTRLYAEEKQLKNIPDSLNFAFCKDKGNNDKRNPSTDKYTFRCIYSPKDHLKYNILASWLLKLIIDNTKSKFNDLPENIQIRALESALFMIGYEINM